MHGKGVLFAGSRKDNRLVECSHTWSFVWWRAKTLEGQWFVRLGNRQCISLAFLFLLCFLRNRLRTNLHQIHVSCFEGRGSLNDDLIELESLLESLSILLIFSTLSERLQLLLGDVHEGHINLALLELGHICFFVRFCFEVVLVINK